MTTAYRTALEAATAIRTLPAIATSSLYSQDPVMKVLAFHHLYDVPMKAFGNEDQQFSHMDNERVALRLSLHIEEFKELLEKGFGIICDMSFRVPGESVPTGSPDIKSALDAATEMGIPRNGKEVMDALGDLNYVDTGMAIEMGYDPRPVLDEIHAGNMTKLGEDGKPIINGVTEGYLEHGVNTRFDPTARHGKVLKGPNYTEPNIPAALGWEG